MEQAFFLNTVGSVTGTSSVLVAKTTASAVLATTSSVLVSAVLVSAVLVSSVLFALVETRG